MRRRLELRAAAAVLADGGATMADVARRLGVAKPTLYKLAGSREELLRACVEAETERLLGHLHAEGAAELAGVVRAVDAYERDSPGGFRLLRRPEAAGARRRVEARLGGDVRAAALLGAAIAAVSRAREQGCTVEIEAL
jgi:AcrR family transcriptional regulator